MRKASYRSPSILFAIFFGAGPVLDRAPGQTCSEAVDKDCNNNHKSDSYDMNPSFDIIKSKVFVDGGVKAIVAADLDLDGLPELIAADVERKISIFKNNGGAFDLAPAAFSLDGIILPLSLAAADFDGDGVLDLAVAVKEGATTGHIAIFRNLGDGTFGDPDRIPLDSIPRFLLAVDLNGDGIADLALSRDGISVLLNRGGAAFDPPLELAAGSQPQGLAAGDLDGDDLLDLVVANEGSSDVTVHLNRGNGAFEAKASYPVGTGPRVVVAQDFDGDHACDLAVACRGSGEIVILRNAGRGRLQEEGRILPGGKPVVLASLDVDGDGPFDLITAIGGAGVEVLRNDGKGGFREAVRVDRSPSDPEDLAAGDFDLNGRHDFCLFAPSNGLEVFSSILPGLGRSTDCNGNCIPDECEMQKDPNLDCNYNYVFDGCDILGKSLDCNANGIPDECEIARSKSIDCDGNGVPDDCEISQGDLADCDGTGIPDGCEIARGAADCNGNGIPDSCDIAQGRSPDCNGNGVPDECDLMMRPGFPGPPGWVDLSVPGTPQSSETGDLDGDGLLDVVVPVSPEGGGSGSLALFFNQGKGVFRAGTMDLAIQLAGSRVALGEFDGDGSLDVAVTGRTDQESSVVQILINKTDGSFTKAGALPVAGSLGAIAAAELNGDGRTDLCVGTFTVAGTSVALRILMSQGGGRFEEMAAIPLSGIPRSIAAGDLDGDRAVDLVVARKWVSKDSPGGVAVLWSRGGPTFDPPVELPDDPGISDPWSLTLADLEGDGDLDLAVVDESRGRVRVFLNRSGRTLARAPDIIIGNEPQSIAAGDLDGDGRRDLIVGTVAGEMRTFLDQGGGAFAAGPVLPAAGKVPFVSVEAADFDGDGMVDVSSPAPGMVRILFNGGGGTFVDPGRSLPVSRSPLVAADLDGDGLLDLASGFKDHVSVLWNGGGRGLGPETRIGCGTDDPAICGGEFGILEPGDFDGDGLLDIVALGGCKGMLLSHMDLREFTRGPVFRASGKPTWTCDQPSSDFIFTARGEDLDGDWNLDLTLGAGHHIWHVQNQGFGSFSPPQHLGHEDFIIDDFNYHLTDVKFLAIGDLNDDGTLEVAIGDGGSPKVLIHSPLRFCCKMVFAPVDGYVQKIIIHDLNGDGSLDMALVEQMGPASPDWRLGFLWNTGSDAFGSGTFGSGGSLAISGPFAAPEVGDLDGDGDPDLAILLPYGFGILMNNGRGVFDVEYHQTRFVPSRLALGDLDGDGDLDIALRGPDPEGTVSVVWNDPRPRSLDLNRDHVPDECQAPAADTKFRRGDASADGITDLSDAIWILSYLFGGGPLTCMKAADVDDSGSLDLTDAICLLGYMFLGKAAPLDPFRTCGLDPTPGSLGCERFVPCN